VAALGRLAELTDPGEMAALWERVKTEPRFGQRDVAELLCLAIEGRCGGQAARLDGEARTPGLATQLRDYVRAASFATNSVEAAAWGLSRSALLQLPLPGLRGAYFTGENFDTPAFERLDERIDFPAGQFGYPDRREGSLSIRWEGFF
jgi:hypothetical protein